MHAYIVNIDIHTLTKYLEKWATVQYFYTKGYVPTKHGWANDCYELGRLPNEEDEEDKENKPLFEKIQEFRDEKLSENMRKSTSRHVKDMRSFLQFSRSLCKEPQQPEHQRNIRVEEKKLSEESLLIRQRHWKRIEKKLDQLIDAENPQLSCVDKEIKIENYFDNSEGVKFYMHFAITLAIFLTGLGSYLLIARNIELTAAVKQGVNVLGSANVSDGGWVCFVLFWLLIIVYFHREFAHDMQVGVSSLGIMCKGCKSEDENIETVFNPPDWDGNDDYMQFKIKTESFVPSADATNIVSDTSQADT